MLRYVYVTLRTSHRYSVIPSFIRYPTLTVVSTRVLTPQCCTTHFLA